MDKNKTNICIKRIHYIIYLPNLTIEREQVNEQRLYTTRSDLLFPTLECL